MSRISIAVKNDLQLVNLLRDELKVQGHLLQSDLKKRFDELELKWSELQERVGRASVAGRKAGDETQRVVKDLVSALRGGYESICIALRSAAPRT